MAIALQKRIPEGSSVDRLRGGFMDSTWIPADAVLSLFDQSWAFSGASGVGRLEVRFQEVPDLGFEIPILGEAREIVSLARPAGPGRRPMVEVTYLIAKPVQAVVDSYRTLLMGMEMFELPDQAAHRFSIRKTEGGPLILRWGSIDSGRGWTVAVSQGESATRVIVRLLGEREINPSRDHSHQPAGPSLPELRLPDGNYLLLAEGGGSSDNRSYQVGTVWGDLAAEELVEVISDSLVRDGLSLESTAILGKDAAFHWRSKERTRAGAVMVIHLDYNATGSSYHIYSSAFIIPPEPADPEMVKWRRLN
ncbi:MAG: hypothetical protein HKL81_10295 [Acidimicrobiaceae bacterium]|nr:hypothetical protein [Acidimicrobiaceae bacterium]